MKKRLKSLFLIAFVFITLGTVMTISGILFGGIGELSKEVAELVHVVRTGVSETVERIPMLESITNINGFTLVVDKDEVSVEVNEEYETLSGNYQELELAKVSEVKNFDISAIGGSMTILPSENGYYGIVSKDANEFQCYVQDMTLYLSVFPKELGAENHSEIILYVPENAELEKVLLFCSGDEVKVQTSISGKELRISSVYGVNSFQEKINFENVTATVGVGELSVKQLIADSLEVEVSNGTATVESMKTKTLSASVGMGSFLANGITEGDITLSCGIGSMELYLEAEQNSYNYDISGSAESVQIGTDTLAGMVMERWIDNGSDQKITLSCSMGSVVIDFLK